MATSRQAGRGDKSVSPTVAMCRLTAQLLVDPLPTPSTAAGRVSTVVEAVGRVLAVQAQDSRGLRLAVRSRTRGLAAADVDRAFAERAIVVTWLNRGTLHLARSEDYPWLHALTAPRQETLLRRRLAEEGVSPAEAERGVDLVERALVDQGPLTRTQLRDLLDAAGIPTARQALIMILGYASQRGVLVRGPMAGAEHAYVLTRDWLGDLAPNAGAGVDRDAALAELAVRYLAGHGPADDRDLAAWSGLTLGDARRGLMLASDRVEALDDGRADLRRRARGARGVSVTAVLGIDGGGSRLGEPGDTGDPDEDAGSGDGRDTGEKAETDLEAIPTRLLGPFDPILHGWAARDWVTGPHRGIVTVNGIFRSIALVAGQAAGTWTMPDGHVALSPFAPLPPHIDAALRAEAADVHRFFATPPDPTPATSAEG
ncbi:winged helix DNA-binding domain-containing protein [Frankia nepalensis]|uniref:winged helix DNA-binding domain-containing protein n=1 Tax=Frankia nepalensis TaxID=1836974 RepID=UPI0027DE7397|nr:winged helix DNA-binding domain-containing protein [Frankia nepalensis]